MQKYQPGESTTEEHVGLIDQYVQTKQVLSNGEPKRTKAEIYKDRVQFIDWNPNLIWYPVNIAASSFIAIHLVSSFRFEGFY